MCQVQFHFEAAQSFHAKFPLRLHTYSKVLTWRVVEDAEVASKQREKDTFVIVQIGCSSLTPSSPIGRDSVRFQ